MSPHNRTLNKVLDLSPIFPPLLKKEPAGIKYDFFQLVNDSEMRNVISTNFPPDIRIHEDEFDFKVVKPGKTIYCISQKNLPENKKLKAKEILRRLAYSYHDYAAREITARYHRDIKRAQTDQDYEIKKNGPEIVKIRRFLKKNPNSSLEDIHINTQIDIYNIKLILKDFYIKKELQRDVNNQEIKYSYINTISLFKL